MSFPGATPEQKRIQYLQQTRILIWLALCFVVFFYGFITYQNQENYRTDLSMQAREDIDKALGYKSTNNNSLMLSFSVGALLMAVLSFALPILAKKQIWVHARLNKITRIELESRLLIPYILAWALSESVAIFGFFVSYTSYVFNYYLPFGVAALVLMFIHRPQITEPQI